MPISINQHNSEIQKKLEVWSRKPLLRKIYHKFYRQVAGFVYHGGKDVVVELGSGIGNIKEVIPGCLRTDLFANPRIDRVENAYSLSFANESVSTIILFDVFHHLRYPGTALKELLRVLEPKGRIIIFDPFISVSGFFIYGFFHHEPIGYARRIEWLAPEGWDYQNDGYYAAQGNATRIFAAKKYAPLLHDWKIIECKKMAAFSYGASGGYSGKQLYPEKLYSAMTMLDMILDKLPFLFATRLLLVLEARRREINF